MIVTRVPQGVGGCRPAPPYALPHPCEGPPLNETGCTGPVQNQGVKFDVARTLSDRSRRGLPCDRSRRRSANQTNLSDTAPGCRPKTHPPFLPIPESGYWCLRSGLGATVRAVERLSLP